MWVSCRIGTASHSLAESAFRVLQLPESSIRVSDVKDDNFRIAFGGFVETDAPERSKVHHTHNATRAFLVALNVATIGMFYWASDPWVHPIYGIGEGPDSPPIRHGALIVPSFHKFTEIKEITDLDVQNALIIFGMLAKEKSPTLESEYARGLLLLRMNFYELNFYREAFMCFWRALENFVATRILGVAKLKNELRDFQRALKTIGASDDLTNELKEVYVVRSSQVAHAQVTVRDITFDEAMKAKVFLDFVMHKTFKAQGVKLLEGMKSA
jgi:hypothetical protein